MIRRPPRSTRVRSSAASDVYKRQAFRRDLLQSRDQRWAIARNDEPLDAGRGTHGERDVARWDADRLGNEPHQRSIRLALARCRAHPVSYTHLTLPTILRV